MNFESVMPYGVHDLEFKPPSTDKLLVPCYVRGCGEVLEVPGRKRQGSYCPVHGIKCFARSMPSYAYRDPCQNIIVDRFEFEKKLLNHPFKFESHRLGYERSEDALTWNVFKSIHSDGQLNAFVQRFVGINPTEIPELFLWGINMETYQPWDLLIQARERFESDLPVDRPLTEPDIAIHIPGELVVLIEAKFTSNNPFYKRGPRANAQSLTMDELISIYRSKRVKSLDLPKANTAERIHYQLWRNLVFAEWMAKQDSPSTRFCVLNLVCHRSEIQSLEEFRNLLTDSTEFLIQRIEWESIGSWVQGQGLTGLHRYMEQKSSGLRPAFATEPSNIQKKVL